MLNPKDLQKGDMVYCCEDIPQQLIKCGIPYTVIKTDRHMGDYYADIEIPLEGGGTHVFEISRFNCLLFSCLL